MDLDSIPDIEALEDWLSSPTPGTVEALARLDGDIVVLGVAGKMGPTLARMARRASDLAGVHRRVIGVARFTDGTVEGRLLGEGVETVRADLLDESALAGLPDAANVVFMAGRKFGTTGQESATWAMNTYLPAPVCQRYRSSRIVAFSTGNVYGPVPIGSGGSRESDTPAPQGEYAMSCLGRERLFEYFGRALAIPTVLIRLNYAVEMRYGVLVDLAERVRDGLPIDLTVGVFNVVWQGDANAMALQAFDQAAIPTAMLNLTGPETLKVREVAEEFGRLLDKPVRFVGGEGPTALLSDATQAFELFGRPKVGVDSLIRWVADWVARGGETLGKPTHFQANDGRF